MSELQIYVRDPTGRQEDWMVSLWVCCVFWLKTVVFSFVVQFIIIENLLLCVSWSWMWLGFRQIWVRLVLHLSYFFLQKNYCTIYYFVIIILLWSGWNKTLPKRWCVNKFRRLCIIVGVSLFDYCNQKLFIIQKAFQLHKAFIWIHLTHFRIVVPIVTEIRLEFQWTCSEEFIFLNLSLAYTHIHTHTAGPVSRRWWLTHAV